TETGAPMSAACWIGMRRPLPTPGTLLESEEESSSSSSPPPSLLNRPPPGMESLTSSLTLPLTSSLSLSPAPLSLSVPASLTFSTGCSSPEASLLTPRPATGASAASPAPAAVAAARAFPPDIPRPDFLRFDERPPTASRAALPMAVPITSETSFAISHHPFSGSVRPTTTPEPRGQTGCNLHDMPSCRSTPAIAGDQPGYGGNQECPGSGEERDERQARGPGRADRKSTR